MRYQLIVPLLFLSVAINAAPIPFDPVRGIVEIEVLIDGRVKGKFGVDTGADRLYIDNNFARANKLAITNAPPQRDVVGLEGNTKPLAISLRSFRLNDDEALYNLSATGIDLASIVKDTSYGIPDGLIGYEILRRYYVSVDYPNREMEFISFEPDFLKGRQYDEVSFDQYQHLILVDVVFNGTVEAPMILDYCASYSTIDRNLAEQLGFDPDEEGWLTISKMELGEELEAVEVPVVIRDYSAFRKSVPRAKFDGILGATFLYRYKITVDYRRKKIYIHH